MFTVPVHPDVVRSAYRQLPSASLRVRVGLPSVSILWVLALAATLGATPSAWAQANFWPDDRPQTTPWPALITNLVQLRGLDRPAAKRGIPVRLRATVTYCEDQWPSLFVQEGESAAYVYRPLGTGALESGDLIEVEGRSGEGFTALIHASTIRKLGQTALPEPIVTALAELGSGRYDGLRVRVRATVRWMHVTYRRLYLHIGEASGRYEVHIPDYRGALPAPLVGAEVELTGITGTKLDGRGHMIGAGMSLTRLEEVRVLRAAPLDPWNRSVQVISTLMYFHPSTSFGQRTKIRGVVTLNTPAGRLYVEDASGGCELRLPAFQERPDEYGQYLDPPRPRDLRTGDLVEVLGYPDPGSYTPILMDAIVRKVGLTNLPPPQVVTASNVLQLPVDSRRVRLHGRVVANEVHGLKSGIQQRLTIDNHNEVFFAEFEGAHPVPAPIESRVELTGVCAFDVDERRRPTGFRVLIPTVENFRLLAGAPLVTTRGLIRVGTPAVGLVLGWVWLLRRQVQRRTLQLRSTNDRLSREVDQRIRAEQEVRKALARERELSDLKTSFVSMVSHEFRTPLEVIVSSADILDRYLDLLPKPERAEHLAAIQHSVKRMAGMMEEVLLLGRFESERQPFRPDDVHLPAVCRRLADEMRSATAGKCPIELALPNPLPLARVDESLLRHMITNLLSNAVKYSPPGVPVHLSLERQGADAIIQVKDDGVGIPTADQSHLFEAFYRGRNTSQISGTGLGLVIVKRSVDLHGGNIAVVSEEGKGTRFTIRLPVFDQSEA